MEIYQIIHFIAIVETGGFTKLADRAAVSQSAMSASLAKLEEEIRRPIAGPAALASGSDRRWGAFVRSRQGNSTNMQYGTRNDR
jgi:Bacterial regulatory helix-turn-helix protein, lysR family